MHSMPLIILEGASARHAREGVVSRTFHSELIQYDASFFSFLSYVPRCCRVGAVFVRLAGFVISEETLSAATAATPVSVVFPFCACLSAVC